MAWGVAPFCHFRYFCGTIIHYLRDKKICEICEICVRLKLFFCVNSAPLRENKSFYVNSSSCSSSSFLDNYLAVLFEKCNFAAGIFIEKCSF